MTLESAPILPQTGLAALVNQLEIPGEVQFPDGSVVKVGRSSEPPLYRLIFRTKAALRTPMTELRVGRAFVAGDIDVEGDLGVLFGAREKLKEKVPLRQKLQFIWDFVRSTTAMNRKAIGEHYNRGDDFYLAFIDKRYRFYSHGIFHSPDETIEEASEHKLESMYNGLGLKPGMRLLDIGGGWGGVTQYCGARGVHVTTLTIAQDSANYIRRLIQENRLPGEVLLQDFLEHHPAKPYDHAVMFGVIEHIPNYRRFARNIWKALKPGGRIYLDGSAAVEKFAVSAFTRQYIWRGTHTFMTLQDVMAEMLYHGFEIVGVSRETQDYGWTMLEWAKRLDEAKAEIVAGWGEETYRVFRLFLSGGAHAFETNSLQAYHLIAERTASPGPRPSMLQRTVQFVRNLR